MQTFPVVDMNVETKKIHAELTKIPHLRYERMLACIMTLSRTIWRITRGKKKFRIMLEYDAEKEDMVSIKYDDIKEASEESDHQDD